MSYKTARKELHEEFMMKTTLIKKKADWLKSPWKNTFVPEPPHFRNIFSKQYIVMVGLLCIIHLR
ncbi:MAG TPA: hypothetical protein DIW05_04385 [Syntrophaceae bacterium]|nr:hypothetical protein [Syntrophaceae bacterium]